MNIVCPIDNKDDTIQKVSAVVASGQSTGTFAGPIGGTVSIDGKSGSANGYSTLSGSSTTSLAKLLAPPLEPTKPKGLGFLWLILFFGPVIVVDTILYTNAYLNRLGINLFDEEGLINAFCAVLGIIIFLYLYNYLSKLSRKKMEQENLRYSNEKLTWQKALERWNKSYYCHKHDIVFDSESGESCPPPSLKIFLYQSKSG